MLDNIATTDTIESVENKIGKAAEIALIFGRVRSGIWLFGIPSWLFGISDRSFAAFADGYLSAIEVVQLFTAALFFASWLFLRPDAPNHRDAIALQECCNRDGFKPGLKQRYMISQEYILPFPYICQIYHLLNLKHLESIHHFSLNNLKVVGISDFQLTENGGLITFQTILDSPFNPLRIWRKPIVEVDLILHNPYTVELSIPVYNQRRITVIFHAVPLNENEHYFFIDIYSDLEWFKPFLQLLLHFASCLTLFEDLPYLRSLAEKNRDSLLKLSKSNCKSMSLYRRFVELYGATLNNYPILN
ncbi:hypothetical protein [Rivularia sp. UHCC 0363]|uniref:hypothetical protein n=1 Tax=Rivularia sp. UHCC 0363 TaxID=3110244 RepID=UPI002B20B9EA|nr:hypothetical protein [Rivularia sp. UHCC 0363]MEA5598318.1 hypothetical protein [Rivularia sp. UHCC 0363]